MDFSLDLLFFAAFFFLFVFGVAIHRSHAMTQLHRKGSVPATYWGTYGEIPIKKEVSDVPKITANGQLTLPKVSKQNADCVAGKIPPGSKSK